MAKKATDDSAKANFGAGDFVQAMEELAKLTEAKDAAVNRIRQARKRWKGLGLNLGQYDAVMKLRSMDGDEIIQDELDRQRYSKWAAIDLGFQATFEFGDIEEPDDEAAERLSKFDSYQAGIAAGRAGDPRSANPSDAGTVSHVAWDQGWQDHDNDEWKAAQAVKPKKAKKGAGPEVTGAPEPDGDKSIH